MSKLSPFCMYYVVNLPLDTWSDCYKFVLVHECTNVTAKAAGSDSDTAKLAIWICHVFSTYCPCIYFGVFFFFWNWALCSCEYDLTI